MNSRLVIGIDYGTDSVRAVMTDSISGDEIASSVFNYPKWADGAYCAADRNQFRQHPTDYLEGLDNVIREVLGDNAELAARVAAIGVDATSSTPCLIDSNATPLALLPQFTDNPNAMFILWKDHTAHEQAIEISDMCRHKKLPYLKYVGGSYSPECFWAKLFHVVKTDPQVANAAYTAVELCDWIPAYLTGVSSTENIRIGRGSAGQKALWAREWGGYPGIDLLGELDSKLAEFASRLDPDSYTSDRVVGTLTPSLAQKWGLSESVVISAGTIDAQACAIGAGVKQGALVASVGTSACFNAVMSVEKTVKRGIEGVSGEIEGGFIADMICYESGMSAFGDLYRWFKQLLENPTAEIIRDSELLTEQTKQQLTKQIRTSLLGRLNRQVAAITITDDLPLASEWINGRRNPFVNSAMTASITGLSLDNTAATLFYALTEATCFGARSIVNHYVANGVQVDKIVAVGGISHQSPFVMQLLADCSGLTIEVPDGKQMGALGAAVCGATAASIYPSIEKAQQAMCRHSMTVYRPREELRPILDRRYSRYKRLEHFTEESIIMQSVTE